MSKKVFIVAGGTGGHFFPAIALADELILREYNVTFITDKRCSKFIKLDSGINFKIIPCDTFRKGIIQKISAVINIFYGVVKSFFCLLQKRPSAVIGFGGYPMVPMLVAAAILRVPIIIHEQNSVMGKANSLFAEYARFIALSFAKTKGINEKYKNKLEVTGNPVRKSIYNLNIERDFSLRPFKILIYGGSQGAVFFSNLIPNAMKVLRDKNKNLKIHIIQQASHDEQEKLKELYDRLNITHEIKEFFFDIHHKFSESHLSINRAGASTISELIATGLPSILVPFPFAVNNHQLHNAEFLVENEAGILMEQHNISPEFLATQIIKLSHHPEILQDMSRNLRSLRIDTGSILATLVEKVSN